MADEDGTVEVRCKLKQIKDANHGEPTVAQPHLLHATDLMYTKTLDGDRSQDDVGVGSFGIVEPYPVGHRPAQHVEQALVDGLNRDPASSTSVRSFLYTWVLTALSILVDSIGPMRAIMSVAVAGRGPNHVRALDLVSRRAD